MGNFLIQIEAVGDHGTQRDIKEGETIDYSKSHEHDVERLAKEFVDAYAKRANIVSATITHWPESTPIVDNLVTSKRELGDFTESSKRFTDERMLTLFNLKMRPWNDGKQNAVDAIGRLYRQLAHGIVRRIPAGPERTVALRDLLNSMDAALRAVLQ
jgi:hypothetical protein